MLAIWDLGVPAQPSRHAERFQAHSQVSYIDKGTGLGLSMVDGPARQLGGTLVLKSKEGSGVQIELWLAVSVADLEFLRTSARTDEADHEDGIVLLVDDEALVRMATADMLDELGNTVVEVSIAKNSARDWPLSAGQLIRAASQLLRLERRNAYGL